MVENLCEHCRKPATLKCSACNLVFYCSKDHQKTHWKIHKTVCTPYKTEINETLGRHLIATRDIKAGEIIMKKQPLVLAPKAVSHPICLGCLKKLPSKPFYCKNCNWPLCSKNCQTSPQHVEECNIFMKNKYEPSVNLQSKKETVYAPIAVIRTLLLKDTKEFRDAMEMQSHLEENRHTQLYAFFKRNLVPLLTDVLKMPTNEEEILTICSIFDTNAFDVRDEKGLINIRGLYPMINQVAHDCKQNTRHYFDDCFNIILTSTVLIKKGELITTTYTQALWGTLSRRVHLMQVKHFECQCLRCQDPSEFGTYAGSILCQKCKDGESKLVCSNPLDQSSVWFCQKCKDTLKCDEIFDLNQKFKAEISSMNKTNPKNLEDFLEKYREILHPTNCHVLEIKYALTQFYGNFPGYRLEELPSEAINRKIQLCKELINIADVLQPGNSKFREWLLEELEKTTVFLQQTKT